MQELINKIKAANAAYANGMPYLTDTEYDVLWQELHALDPSNEILYHTSKDLSIPGDFHTHLYKIKGVQKAFSMKDLKPFLTRFKNEELLIQPKYDGVAAVIYRENTSSNMLVLFGDGTNGRDISMHLNSIEHVPPESLYSRVELVIPNWNWNSSFGKNPRNVVAGWVNSSSIKYPDTIKAIPHEGGPLEQHYSHVNMDELETLLLRLYAEWSKEVPMDGLMLKVADPHLRLTSDDHPDTYAWSIAWKPPISTKETTVTDIEWNVSRSGRIIPTIIYEPIQLCGTTNTRVTGNNAQWLQDHMVSPGRNIIVGKAGEIIPKIIRVIGDYDKIIALPTLCPICNEELSWKGKDLICNSPTCIVQLSKSIAYFYSDKGMDVKSIGEAMITDLLYNDTLRNILSVKPWVLLEPLTYNLIDLILPIWGKKRLHTYLTNQEEVNKKKNPAQFIAALGLPGLAYKTAIKLYHQLNGQAKQSHTSSKSIFNFAIALGKLKEAEKDFSSFSLAPLPAPPKMTYCITGELSSPRNDMISYLTTKDWQFSNQVSKFTDILILGASKRVTTKQQKAKELGILTITEDELPKYIKD